MQKVLIVVAVVVLMASCARKGGDFEVKAIIKNAPAGKMLYIEKFALTDSVNATFDSAKLKATGEYILKGKGNEENLYLLAVDKDPIAIIINDNVNTQVTLDYNNLRKPEFKGSEASQSLYAFVGQFVAHDSVIRAISGKMDAIARANPQDSSLKMLQMMGMREVQAINTEITNVVQTSQHPALICYVLDQARNMMPLADIEALATKASARFSQHSGLAVIKSKVKQAVAYEQQQKQGQQGQGMEETASPLVNQQAPNLTMPGVDGKPVSISGFKGKYVLVDFWASWCGPCRAENPNVVAAYNKYKNKNFTILGVSLDQKKDAWEQAIKQDGLAWNHMSDLKYWSSEAVSAYGIQGIPFNVLLDPTGKIIAASLRGPALEQKLEEVLK